MNKWVSGFENLYRIYSDGYVLSYQRRRGHRVVPSVGKHGYMRVRLCKRNNHKRYLIHRLVLSEFSRKPLQNEEASHLDGNTSNNRLSNLRWVTHSANLLEKRLHGTGNGENHPRAKLTIEIVKRIFALKKAGLSEYAIADEVCSKRPTVHSVLSGQNWSHALKFNDDKFKRI